MTVVLLDPLRPDTIPIRAWRHLTGTVLVTEDVPAALLWELGHVEPALDDSDPSLTLLSADRNHSLVTRRIELGEDVVAAERVPGDDLLEAVALMDTLRRNGPWESTQTHVSLRRYLLEEVYELLDAIDSGDPDDLREELGDLLLQVLFHSRIAADDPERPFDVDDVARSFTVKVSHRTPGVLSGAHADLETQIREWEERKAAEKNRGSVLDGIATTAPALSLTQKVLERLEAADFPMETIDPIITTVLVAPGGDSIEELTRQRTRALMDQVRNAESRAAEAGVALTTRDAWSAHLE
ncbi:MazG family protein [Gordonia sp. NPDC003424]